MIMPSTTKAKYLDWEPNEEVEQRESQEERHDLAEELHAVALEHRPIARDNAQGGVQVEPESVHWGVY
jgi:hypothetical protein